jgi:hypothetical protein
MSYFRELPDLEYQSFLKDKKASDNYVLVKNLFRRIKLPDDLQNVFTIFNKYQIADGSRPDTIAEEIYGSSEYDWVVLISAGITRIRDEWPLSDSQLYEYAENIYGGELNGIHHYETVEVRDSQNRLILPAGKVVDSNFSIPDPNKRENKIAPVIGVTNYQHEVRLNDKKRTIYVLKPIYLQQILNETRNLLLYDISSQYVDERTIKTENTSNLIP